VNVISKRGLDKLAESQKVDLDVNAELNIWFHVARRAHWTRLAEVQDDYPSVDQVGKVLVFNIRHNRYRLIATVSFAAQQLYVKALLTHKEYDRKEWRKWA